MKKDNMSFRQAMQPTQVTADGQIISAAQSRLNELKGKPVLSSVEMKQYCYLSQKINPSHIVDCKNSKNYEYNRYMNAKKRFVQLNRKTRLNFMEFTNYHCLCNFLNKPELEKELVSVD